MKNSLFLLLACVLILSACKKEEAPNQNNANGQNMLLIGNSFFRPYAEQLDVLALDAGFSDHESTIVMRGGDNGRPINFWNDSSSAEHNSIKAALDQGNIDIFGMTAGHDTDDRIEGHRAWINYALQSNPDISIFIAIPTIDFPESWDSTVQAYGFNTMPELYSYFVNDIVHDSMVNQLRAEFPSTNIFTIPTGWAAVDLHQMYQDSSLLDSIDFMGPKESSLFTDQKGHQGQIIIETGSLIWLSSLYNVDLNSNNYQTGFNTDLHQVAQNIINNHDPNYKK